MQKEKKKNQTDALFEVVSKNGQNHAKNIRFS